MSKKRIKTKNNAPLIVTGLSGAGISSVLKALEDLNYEVFDNFPLGLVDPLIEETGNTPIAIGIDTRTRGFETSALRETVKRIGANMLFITCDEDVLQKRFTETRRRHPLSGNKSLLSGIRAEKELFGNMQSKADLVIDSSHMSIHDLRHILEGHFHTKKQKKLTITLMSFGFRNGVPREADIIMDVRFLQNPHWVPKLKSKTGKK